MHAAVREFVAQYATDDPCIVLECGARDVNGTVRDLFPAAEWVGVDLQDGPGTDVVADFADYTHPHLVDFVVSTEVLEHTPRWPEIVAAAAANLKPGGTFICTAAGPGRRPHSAIDEQPIREWEHYENIDPDRLREVMHEHFDWVGVFTAGLDVQAVGRR